MYNAFSNIPKVTTEEGSPEAPTYEYRIDKKTGRKISVPNGVTNLYNKIQSHLEQSKLENIIKRAMNGEIGALEKANGQYIDISDAPKTMLEAQDMILRIKNEFEELPLETKRAFDFNVEVYVSKYGTNEWLNLMGYTGEKEKPIEEKVIEEVITNESE